ncbi:hypothetical protein GLOTRDRAFT_37261 [Gloeophyllum trabeum ATCC 11539]|uniref:Kinetochore protein NDC80 n=1 Tax=Gloeophyllum trabeum (strain ATCC 11539 / FP-39264 / Madison 617) TaxID=670483 RepID=S7QHI1_GLOTA|nr:uncharacterized protein GLOTRDRAFT_37261 [Gloeophyllum trabeum ATCC 11539]EPQ58622.1 hypothetical protein GLOTRDRAFT_37261 [Gloeophyllum trabeum ATCC 11539]
MRGPTGTGPRPSIYRSTNVNPLLQSVSKAGIGRTPMKSSARRGSTWMGAAPGSQGAPPMRDPRPLRDKAYQSKMRQEILGFLHSVGYEISREALASITGKDFRAIFEFLIGQLDPNYPFDSLRRLEEQFIPALKCMQYPFVGALDPKWLAAPASMHSWPSLLGVLHWLVELCKAKWHYTSSGDPTLQDPNDVPEQFDSEDHHTALAFQYLDTTYQLYLEGMDTFPEQDKILEEYYLRKNAKVLEELNHYKAQLQAIKDEYERLRDSAPPLEKLLVDSESVKRDEKKLQEMLRHRESRKAALEASIKDEEEKINAGIKNLDRLRQEEAHYQDVLQAQNLSPEEVMRMNTEHENLQRTLEDLRQKLSETHKTIGFLEPTATNRIAEAEESLDAYTNLLDSLALFPPLPPPLPNVDLRMTLNTAASSPADILRPDVRMVIKPNLNRIAEIKMKERAAVETERIAVEDALDMEAGECEDTEGEVAKLEKKVIALNDQADNIRDAAQQEAFISNEEATRLTENLAQAKAAAYSSGVGVQTRLKGLQIQYAEQVERVNRLKEETVRVILKNCNDIGAFKREVESRLNAVKVYAENN